MATCTPPQPLDLEIDRSLITGKPCAAPCWHGLEIGVSTKEEVKSTLAKLPFVDQESIEETETGWWVGDNDILFTCTYSSGRECGRAVIKDDKLYMLWLLLVYDLTLSDMVTEFGEPDYVSLFYGSGEQVLCDISVYWPEFDMVASGAISGACSTITERDSGVRISPDLLMDDVTFGLHQRLWITDPQGSGLETWQGFTQP